VSRAVVGLAWRWGRLVVLGVLGAWLVLGALAWFFQRRLIYFPDAGPVERPTGPGWDGLEDVEIPTEDGVTLCAWYLPGPGDLTALVFHGNAGHRGHRTELVQGLRRLGLGVLLPDYRGYGGSGGTPSEEGLYADARACRRWLQARAPGRFVYVGSSIGTGVAVDLAAREAPAGLVLLAPFPSLRAVARRAYPIFPVGPFLRDRYPSIDKIGEIACPLLVVHGEADAIVPLELGRALFDEAPEPKRFVAVPGAGHNDLIDRGGRATFEALRAFLGECCDPAARR
jgi:fermentation-respiration switch protein FrsA (DUF1100 family)